jgi:hypothetical protein
VGTVPSMRTRRALQLAAVVVAVAVTGHLLMHLQPHDHFDTVGDHDVAGHAATTSSTLVGAHATSADPDGGAHLMAALCMGVLAVAALWRLAVLTGWSASSVLVAPAATERRVPRQQRAPPRVLSRIDAGVLLRV